MKEAIKRIKANHPDYGYRRVHACLPGVNHKKVQRLMQVLGLQVRSRKGNCLDNVAMESFFGRLKTEYFYGKEFKTKEEIVEAVKDYLDYYSHRRIQLKLKGLSPIQYRK
nr:IS3 family transposase [Haemophilus haemolyticus]